MRIAVVTDAWHPQVNGVVQTYGHTARTAADLGHAIEFVSPAEFRTFPCPTYPDIRLAWRPYAGVSTRLDALAPDAIHVATEGPLGHAAQAYCRKRGLSFTTAYHTQFPEYVRARAPIPEALTYAYVRRWHARAARTMVPTPSMRDRLAARGFDNLAVWPRGVDTSLFRPLESGQPRAYDGPRPHLLYMGRVAVEKNIEAFLDLDIAGTKYVVGDGPDLDSLTARYPGAHFLGRKRGEALAHHVASADCFVFPSRTDTFGLVLLEAMACGVPVAAFPVTGPVDVVDDGRSGSLDENLARAIEHALTLDPADCVAAASQRTWHHATQRFLDHLVPARC